MSNYRNIADVVDAKFTELRYGTLRPHQPPKVRRQKVPKVRSTRDEAQAAGLTRYLSSTPCIDGHTGQRFVSNYSCCECQRLRGNRGNRGKT